MYLGLEIIDFHTHFPTNKPWFTGMGQNHREEYMQRRGERRAKILQEQAASYSHEWRLAWDFEPAEKNPPDDDTQAQRWADEVEKYGLRAVGFVTGGGNEHLASIVAQYPDKFIGFAHHYPFAETAAGELKRAVTEL